MTQAQQFIAFARSLVGKARWRHMGRKPWAVDCGGLVELSARAAGFTRGESPKRYGREPWDDMLRKSYRAVCGEPVTDWRPGDVALFRDARDTPIHLGIIADHPDGGLSVIHVHNLHGVVEQRLAGDMRSRVVEVYRLFHD